MFLPEAQKGWEAASGKFVGFQKFARGTDVEYRNTKLFAAGG